MLQRPLEIPAQRTPADRQSLFDGAAGAILASEPVTADMLAGAASLKVIARSGVGYDSIDIKAAQRCGIRVCSTPGVNHDAVAEMTIGLTIMAARSLSGVIQSVKDSHWPRTAGRELRGATLGIIGYGPSGRAVAKLRGGQIAGAALDVVQDEPLVPATGSGTWTTSSPPPTCMS